MRMNDVPEYGYPIPKYPTRDFAPKEIRHYRVHMYRKEDELRFDLHYKCTPIEEDEHLKEVKDYALNAESPRHHPNPSSDITWTLPVHGEQCYIVLDLSGEWKNWRFAGRAMTSKNPPPKQDKGRDFGLWAVVAPEKSPEDKAVKPLDDALIGEDEICKRIFFGVAERKKDEYGTCHMNFITGFVEASGSMLPVIYDPDVPNTGLDIPPGRPPLEEKSRSAAEPAE